MACWRVVRRFPSLMSSMNDQSLQSRHEQQVQRTLIKVDVQQALIRQRELRMGDLISFPKSLPNIGQLLPREEPMPALRGRPVVGRHHDVDSGIARISGPDKLCSHARER